MRGAGARIQPAFSCLRQPTSLFRILMAREYIQFTCFGFLCIFYFQGSFFSPLCTLGRRELRNQKQSSGKGRVGSHTLELRESPLTSLQALLWHVQLIVATSLGASLQTPKSDMAALGYGSREGLYCRDEGDFSQRHLESARLSRAPRIEIEPFCVHSPLWAKRAPTCVPFQSWGILNKILSREVKHLEARGFLASTHHPEEFLLS